MRGLLCPRLLPSVVLLLCSYALLQLCLPQPPSCLDLAITLLSTRVAVIAALLLLLCSLDGSSLSSGSERGTDGWDTSAPPPEQTPPPHTASVLALRAIRSISPVRPADRRRERWRLERGRSYRARLAVLRDMRDFFQLPQPRRPVPPPRVDRTTSSHRVLGHLPGRRRGSAATATTGHRP